VIKLEDSGNGKANVLYSVDMTENELEDEIEVIKKLPWTSIVMNDRVLVIDEYSFSLRSSFVFQRPVPDYQKLIQESNLPATLQSC